MASKEFTGKNVQDTIKKGLEEMGLSIDEADIEIVSEGGGGLFGIGAKKAVIRITPIDDDFTIGGNKSGSDIKGDYKAQSFKEKAEAFADRAEEKVEEIAEVIKERAKDVAEDLEDLADRAGNKLESFGERIEEQLEKEEKELQKAIDKSMDSTKHVEFITNFLSGLFERMGISCTYDIMQKGDVLTVNISSNETGKLIGHRGETLDAIQYITRLALHKQDLPYRSVIVQTENYREKREQTLRNLAKRLEAKVERTGKKITLEPMKPYERRIIHETLQSSKTVNTDSFGEEPNRYVVIMPKKQ